jgi:mannobiose 2-epimerase
MARLYPTDADEYARRFTMLWEYVKTYVIDWKHGGWLAAGLDANPESRKRPKATIWKDASHETEALLDSLLMLREF